MKLSLLNESLYSDLPFDYKKSLKSYVARTKDETISVTPGFGPFDGYFKVMIEDDSGILFDTLYLDLKGSTIEDELDTVSSIISSAYSKVIDIESISDIYNVMDRFESELRKRLRERY